MGPWWGVGICRQSHGAPHPSTHPILPQGRLPEQTKARHPLDEDWSQEALVIPVPEAPRAEPAPATACHDEQELLALDPGRLGPGPEADTRRPLDYTSAANTSAGPSPNPSPRSNAKPVAEPVGDLPPQPNHVAASAADLCPAPGTAVAPLAPAVAVDPSCRPDLGVWGVRNTWGVLNGSEAVPSAMASAKGQGVAAEAEAAVKAEGKANGSVGAEPPGAPPVHGTGGRRCNGEVPPSPPLSRPHGTVPPAARSFPLPLPWAACLSGAAPRRRSSPSSNAGCCARSGRGQCSSRRSTVRGWCAQSMRPPHSIPDPFRCRSLPPSTGPGGITGKHQQAAVCRRMPQQSSTGASGGCLGRMPQSAAAVLSGSSGLQCRQQTLQEEERQPDTVPPGG